MPLEKRRVVITGMGLVSCFGTDVKTFYRNLMEGKSGVRPVTAFDCSSLPTKFGAAVSDFNPELFLDKKQARRVDPCIAYGVAAGKLALQYANLDPDALDKTKAGVLIGSGMGGMPTYNQGVRVVAEKGYDRVSPFFIPYVITNMAGGLLGVEFGF